MASRIAALVVVLASVSPLLTEENWPAWRGPSYTGEAPADAAPPTEWSEEKNIRWKVEIPGRGSSTPIIWGDKLFVLTAVDTGEADPAKADAAAAPAGPFGIVAPKNFYEFLVICLDRNTGEELWRKTATKKTPYEGTHGDNNYASASPVTDGERLYAWFGSQGLYCYDLDGELQWEKDLGTVQMRASFGEGCSPALHGNRLVINRDQEAGSYIVCLDAVSGETLWQKERDEPSAWATPLVVEYGGKTQVITSASNRVRSYDVGDGALLWECSGQVGNVTPCPVRFEDTAICMSGFRGYALQAIALDATGDVTDTDKIVWSRSEGTPYIPSPLLAQGLLYFNQSNNGILSCVDAKTGEVVFDKERMEGIDNIYASPIAAGGKIYFVGRGGKSLVIDQGREYKVLAENTLDEGCDASPAAIGDALYLRSSKHLYCISEK